MASMPLRAAQQRQRDDGRAGRHLPLQPGPYSATAPEN